MLFAASTSDSEKQSKPLVDTNDTPDEAKISSGAIRKFGGMGRGVVFTSGEKTILKYFRLSN